MTTHPTTLPEPATPPPAPPAPVNPTFNYKDGTSVSVKRLAKNVYGNSYNVTIRMRDDATLHTYGYISVADYNETRNKSTKIIAARLSNGIHGMSRGTYLPIRFDKAYGGYVAAIDGILNTERITEDTFDTLGIPSP